MRQLKNEALRRCVSLLREFVEEPEAVGNKKEMAVLALNHLQRVIAGEELTNLGCVGRPIADRS
jgi:hypothetical protein